MRHWEIQIKLLWEVVTGSFSNFWKNKSDDMRCFVKGPNELISIFWCTLLILFWNHILNAFNYTFFQANESFEPVWMDLAYVPHHGCKNYTDVEFFKRIRARYYVFSGVEPCKDVFNALLEAKKTWENKDQGMWYLHIRYLHIIVYIVAC